MDEIVNSLKYIIPDIKFIRTTSFCWSPANQTISYPKEVLDKKVGEWSLLHETGHAFLGHTDYALDIDLLLLEVQAWEKAKEIGIKIGLVIDEEHIQDCIDTYRDWLHQRSTCPRCGLVSLQTTPDHYKCHNCSCDWQVTASRFCRPYRRSKSVKSKRPLQEQNSPLATFHDVLNIN